MGEAGLCPVDITSDEKQWGPALELAARCGFVVICVKISVFVPLIAAQAGLAGLAWARESWDDAAVIAEPQVAVDPGLPPPLPKVGVIGHSWGAKAAAQLALDRQVRCMVGVSGTFDDNESTEALRTAKVPSLFIAATADDVDAAKPKAQPFCNMSQPRHQVTLLDIGHWDLGDIGPCDGTRPAPTTGSRVIAAEVITVFLHRYLYNANTLHPSLLSAPIGSRPPVLPHVTGDGICAVQSRWQDPFTDSSGEKVLGSWPEGVEPWFAPCPSLIFSSTLLLFGSTAIGDVKTKVVSIKNSSENAVAMSFPGSSGTFEWASFNGTLEPGAAHTLSVSFSPPSTAIATASLTVTSTALGSPHVIKMSGKGLGGFRPP
jgi:hypothetical protein